MKRIYPRQFNFQRNWKRISTHLHNVEVRNALNLGMLEFVDFRNEQLKEKGESFRIGWRPGQSPASLSVCPVPGEHYRFKEAKPGSLNWYRPIGCCHLIAYFVLEVAKLIYPNDQWLILKGSRHSVVTNKDRSVVFDILMFKDSSARESLLFAGDSPQNDLELTFIDLLQAEENLIRRLHKLPPSSKAFMTTKRELYRTTRNKVAIAPLLKGFASQTYYGT